MAQGEALPLGRVGWMRRMEAKTVSECGNGILSQGSKESKGLGTDGNGCLSRREEISAVRISDFYILYMLHMIIYVSHLPSLLKYTHIIYTYV